MDTIKTFTKTNRLPYSFGGGPLPSTTEPVIQPGDWIEHESPMVGHGSGVLVTDVSDDFGSIWIAATAPQRTLSVSNVTLVRRPGYPDWTR